MPAITSLLGRIGTSQSIEAFPDLESLISSFDISAFGRATAKFSTIELGQINSKTLQSMAFTAVKDELEKLKLQQVTEMFWDAVKGNIETLEDVKMWWDICHLPIDFSQENQDFLDQATQLIGEDEVQLEKLDGSCSKPDKCEGKTLFMPLRLALTGKTHGPDMGKLLPFIGETHS